MKKIVSALLAICLLCFFAACNGKDKDGGSSEDPDTSSVTVSVVSDTGSTTASVIPSTAAQTAVSSKKSTVSTKPAASKPSANTKPAASQSTTQKPASKPAAPSVPKPASSAPEPVETAKDQIIGNWVTEMDMSSMLEAQGFVLQGPVAVKVMMKFTENNEMIMEIDATSYRNAVYTLSKQMLEAQLGPNAMVSGMSIDAYVQMQVDEMMREMHISLQDIGAYKFVGDALWVKESLAPGFESIQYHFSDRNTLALTDADGITMYLKRVY